eukprot:601869-Lingulodinium_polyedra.AAC.1
MVLVDQRLGLVWNLGFGKTPGRPCPLPPTCHLGMPGYWRTKPGMFRIFGHNDVMGDQNLGMAWNLG